MEQHLTGLLIALDLDTASATRFIIGVARLTTRRHLRNVKTSAATNLSTHDLAVYQEYARLPPLLLQTPALTQDPQNAGLVAL